MVFDAVAIKSMTLHAIYSPRLKKMKVRWRLLAIEVYIHIVPLPFSLWLPFIYEYEYANYLI